MNLSKLLGGNVIGEVVNLISFARVSAWMCEGGINIGRGNMGEIVK